MSAYPFMALKARRFLKIGLQPITFVPMLSPGDIAVNPRPSGLIRDAS
jgi:hypothetical protein